jgi:hypothetical protein
MLCLIVIMIQRGGCGPAQEREKEVATFLSSVKSGVAVNDVNVSML